jgi:bifunctional DNA-binding transcriptional regulator/antitoxin component of YhaV-PrlF toxin-antitoxin module
VDRVVAIRDGRLSSETMRQAPTLEDLYGKPTAGAEEPHAPVFEELVVLDSAGRLQVPKEYLQRFNIKGRARLEATENGVLILPVEQHDEESERAAKKEEMTPEMAPRGLRAQIGRIRGKR